MSNVKYTLNLLCLLELISFSTPSLTHQSTSVHTVCPSELQSQKWDVCREKKSHHACLLILTFQLAI